MVRRRTSLRSLRAHPHLEGQPQGNRTISTNFTNTHGSELREVTGAELTSVAGGFGILETIVTEVIVDTVKGAFTRSLYDDVKAMIEKGK